MDDRATPVVDELIERYGDAVTTLHRIYLSAEGFDIHKDKGSQNAHGFAGWMKSVMPDIKHELAQRHRVDL